MGSTYQEAGTDGSDNEQYITTISFDVGKTEPLVLACDSKGYEKDMARMLWNMQQQRFQLNDRGYDRKVLSVSEDYAACFIRGNANVGLAASHAEGNTDYRYHFSQEGKVTFHKRNTTNEIESCKSFSFKHQGNFQNFVNDYYADNDENMLCKCVVSDEDDNIIFCDVLTFKQIETYTMLLWKYKLLTNSNAAEYSFWEATYQQLANNIEETLPF